MSRLRSTFKELSAYPSALVGLSIILLLVAISIYTVITIPYSEAIHLWRGGPGVWDDVPEKASPSWLNVFRRSDLPGTLIMNSQDEAASKTREQVSESVWQIECSFSFDYQYDQFPNEIIIFFDPTYKTKHPAINLTWVKPPTAEDPEGQEIRLDYNTEQHARQYRISQTSVNEKLDRRMKRLLGATLPQHIGLFTDPASITEGAKAGEERPAPRPLQGTYTLRVSATVFEPEADVDVRLVVYGLVHGWAGTDHLRRDLGIALLWGTPIALAFGLLAAVGTTVITMIIAGIGTWYGGWLDEVIQRVTEVNMILPFLPILIMIGTFYSKSLWVMLGVVILLSIFGGAIKTYRAMLLQVKESAYIEAARAYGAGNMRIIFRYLLPRIIPMLIPGLVVAIPGFVFLEAALGVLGLGDPTLPTWGKVINEAYNGGALHQGQYYWILEPSLLLIITGFAFALVGFSLDRVFNPRLRGL
jgi:peptide/nickel transport system permease protein